MIRMPMIVTVFLAAAAVGAEPNQPPEGFVSLFNGKDLSGWRGMSHISPYDWEAMSPEDRQERQTRENAEMQKHWRVENGEIVNDGKGPFLTTEKDYGDIEFFIDWKIVPKGDSGLYLRGTPQVQIWDTTKEAGYWPLGARFGSGSLWNNKEAGKNALVHADNPVGQWNTFHITMKGDRVSVELNGKLVVDDVPLENYWDASRPLPERGPIQLQTHGGEIRWRNVFLREL